MIYDSLENAALYYSLHPLFQKAFAALQSKDWNQLECGRYEIEGDALFVNLAEYQTFLPDQGKWEAHRKYIDIQLIIKGEERMGHAFINSLQVQTPYDDSQDVEFLSGSGQLITYSKSTFAIYFPYDAHKPGLITDAPGAVRKAVAKVLL